MELNGCCVASGKELVGESKVIELMYREKRAVQGGGMSAGSYNWSSGIDPSPGAHDVWPSG
jgi:hypothetical protein